MFTFKTAGESHGPCLTVIVDGVPADVAITAGAVDLDLARRQVGYGRGGRMRIETDRAEFTGGVRWGRTTGAPVAMLIGNRDWENWKEGMNASPEFRDSIGPLTEARPGHADFAGATKYGHTDARNILERSSARETAARVAAGAVAKAALSLFEIKIGSFVDSIAGVSCGPAESLEDAFARAERSDLRMPDEEAAQRARSRIDEAKKAGDTLGGVFTVYATGLPVGLGSHVGWTERLDGRIAGAVVSIPAIKAVEFGMGFAVARTPGSRVHDQMYPGGDGDALKGFVRRETNNAGGLEGGITNGEPLVLRAAMKPIPTLMSPLNTVDIATGKAVSASKERSDVCAVAAAAVVGEAMLAVVLADAFFAKFGGDSIGEAKRNFEAYLDGLGKRWARP